MSDMTFGQDVIVTLVALTALAIVLRRLVGFARAKAASPKCAGCESSGCAPVPSAPDASASVPAAATNRHSHPVVFLRSRP
jgi:hypothetical protein